MNQSFINEVTNQLSARVDSKALTAWSLSATESRSLQRLYAAPDGATLSCHQSRRVEGEAFKLSVFIPSEQEGLVGTATIDLAAYRPIERQIDEAIRLAACGQNQAWTLAGPPAEAPAPVETCDPEVRDHPEKVATLLEDQFTAAFAATTECHLNSAELFVDYSRSQQINSEDLAYETEWSELYLEAAMEPADQINDKEVHEHTTSVTVADLDVGAFVAECALQVATLGDSQEPATTSKATLLIQKDALSEMLAATLDQLNRANEYLKLPFLDAGEVFGGGEGDALSLDLDPTIPCMVLSSAYGADGLPAMGGTLIEHNVVKQNVIGNRFGQYLDRTPNGLAGNLIVGTGSLEKTALAGRAYIEIIKFSSLLIDSRKLTWSSEIKLGKQYAADGTVTLVKGGVASGNLRDNFTDCQFSTTEGTVNVPKSSYAPPLGYRGPDAMLITKGVSIAGIQAGK